MDEKNHFSFFLFRVLWIFLRGAVQNHFLDKKQKNHFFRVLWLSIEKKMVLFKKMTLNHKMTFCSILYKN